MSSILVKLKPGIDPRTVTAQIYLEMPDAVPITSPQLFGTFRDQMLGLLGAIMVFIGLAWVLSAVLICLVFSMSIAERQRQMGILRAVGATRWYVFKSLLAEGLLLASTAALVGSGIGALSIFAFQSYFSGTLKMPFLFPSVPSVLGIFAVGLVVSLTAAAAATIYPAAKISHMEPAMGMRE